MGGDIEGTGGTVPPKFEVGTARASAPHILRSSVIECEAKYELTKKRCQGGIFLSKIEVFVNKKGVIYVIYQISDKIESKKGRQKFWGVKWKFVPKKGHSKISVPQSRRQVSANALETVNLRKSHREFINSAEWYEVQIP